MNQATTGPELTRSDSATLTGINQLATITTELDEIGASLRAAEYWRPSAGLLAELEWCRTKIEQLRSQWGRKLIVALVGPSGAGKSTLLNALAGREISETGRNRPTTRQVVIYTKSMADAEDLERHLGNDQVQVETDYQAAGLEYLILVDTPDTNTLPENQQLLTRVLERADLLLTLFPAQNPKMHDNILFLRPFIRLLPSEAVIPVLNFVDRAPLDELQNVIVPDFRNWIAKEWGLDSNDIYLVSAKASIEGAEFPVDEKPLHGLNEIGRLRALLYGSLNEAGQVTDRRLARAEHLLNLVKADCRRALNERAPARKTAFAALVDIGRRATQALRNMPAHFSQSTEAASLYTILGQRWWGPMGWLIVLWSLLLQLGSFLGRFFRAPRSAFKPEAGGQAAHIPSSVTTSSWSSALQQIQAERWPLAADALVDAGFANAVRQPTIWEEWAERRIKGLDERWNRLYNERLNRTAEKLSFWLLQLIFNAPVLSMIGWLAVQTVYGFFQQHYLTADYFRHAGYTTAVVWLGSFIVLQIVVSLAIRGALRRSLAMAIAEEGEFSVPFVGQFKALELLEHYC